MYTQVYDVSAKIWRDLAVDIRLERLSHQRLEGQNVPDGKVSVENMHHHASWRITSSDRLAAKPMT